MRFHFLFALVIVYISCKPSSTVPVIVTEKLSTIKSKYAPDKRTRIFDITPRMENGKLILKGETYLSTAKEELLKSLANSDYLDSIEILPTSTLGNTIYGIITIPVANMRSNAGHSSELSNQVLCGTVLRLYKTKGNWIYCQTPDDYLGWIDQDAIFTCDSSGINNWYANSKFIINQDQTYVRESASPVSNIVTPLSSGAIVSVNNKSKDFAEVSLPDGRKGFLPINHGTDFKSWKKLNSESLIADQLIKTAHSLLGRPYLWGGTSANGMDCSGFTKSIFFNNGFVLPRDASQQVQVGLPIETDTAFANLQIGDLLFFGRKASTELPEKITHVAMYIGNGEIMHASGYVRIQSLKRGSPTFTEERLKTFVRATRPLAAPKEHGILAVNDIKWYQ